MLGHSRRVRTTHDRFDYNGFYIIYEKLKSNEWSTYIIMLVCVGVSSELELTTEFSAHMCLRFFYVRTSLSSGRGKTTIINKFLPTYEYISIHTFKSDNIVVDNYDTLEFDPLK